MKKKIGILGSTGSIGENTVRIISNNKKDLFFYLQIKIL